MERLEQRLGHSSTDLLPDNADPVLVATLLKYLKWGGGGGRTCLRCM